MNTTRLSQHGLPRRSLIVAVVLTLVFVGFPTQPVIPLSAQTEMMPWEGSGISLWVNTTEGTGGLVWSASSSIAEGLIHSNRDLTINGSNNLMLGGTEYVRRLRVVGRKNLFNPPATKVSPAEFPVKFEIADYRPGGKVALAAGSQYYDGSSECEVDGTWERHVQGTEIITGLHYVPCDAIISAADITGSFTIVAEGSIQVTAARMNLGPAFTDDLLLFSNAGTNNAILIAGDDLAFDGFVYAPLGSAMLSGGNFTLRCGVLANEIAINGWEHRFTGDPTCGNHPPIAVDDAYTTNEDVVLSVKALGVLGNDSDADGDPLTASLVADVSNGTLTLQADGSFTYTPSPDFYGADSFTYEACDTGTPPSCATAPVTIMVNAVNDPPVADPVGPYSGIVRSAVSFDGSGSSDVDGTIVFYDWNFGDGTTGSGASRSHTYATVGFYTVTLTVTDDGGLTDTESTTANITQVPNAAPVSIDDTYITEEDGVLTVMAAGVLGNDTDADGDLLTASLVVDVSNGTLSLQADGSFTYTPDLNFNGEDSFTYVAGDGTADSNIATVTLTVNAVNDPPVADANGLYSAMEGSAVSFDGSGSSDVDGTIVSYAWDFGDGTTGSGATPGHIYEVAGLYTVSLTVTDNGGLIGTGTTTADIAEIPNTAPVAVHDAYDTDEDVTLSMTAPGVLGNDTDADADLLTASLVTGVTNGILTLNTDGSFTYAPSSNFYGVDSFTYHANDGTADSNIATMTITVNPVNDPPTAHAGPDQAVRAGDLVTLDGSASSDPESDTLSYLWTFLVRPAGSAADLTEAASVAPTFIPDLPGSYTIELTVNDGNGGSDTDTVTVTTERIGMTISLVDTLVGVLRTTDGTITFDNPAPSGGITVTLSLDTSIATVDPVAVFIAGGATKGSFVLTAVAVGATTITGNSPATETATVGVQVTDSLISIGNIPVIAPDESADLPVSITKPAPPGGVTIYLESLDLAIAITDPIVFVPEGFYVPTVNPKVTGVNFGTTKIKATALGFGPDLRSVTVALTVTLSPATLTLPEQWTLYVTTKLSAPAPSGGVTLNLSLDQPLATMPESVYIPAGQILSSPIGITGGTTLGTTVLRAGGSGFIEGTATINVVDTPDVYLVEGTGSGQAYRHPVVVGKDLQVVVHAQLEVVPPVPVDVVVSAPSGSGVLFSLTSTGAGSETLVVKTGLTGGTTQDFYLQGMNQGNDINDDVPVMIDVYKTGTNIPVGYEQADKPTRVDVGPSGFQFTGVSDLAVTTFPNKNVDVQSWVLYDSETGTLHNRRYLQQTRGGYAITVDLTNSNPSIGTVVALAVFSSGSSSAVATFDGLTAGITTLGIIQPAGYTNPANGYLTRNVVVTAPDVYLVEGPGQDGTYRDPFVVGKELQIQVYVVLQVMPPVPADVVVSAPAGAGVLFSLTAAGAGSESLVVKTGLTGNTTPYFYLQGTVQGDDTDDDVPVTIEVYETGTTIPVGYEQADKPTRVDVGPSGFDFNTSANLNTTTFSPNVNVTVYSYLLYDGESGTLDTRRTNQQVRGGHTTTVDLTNSNSAVGTVVTPAVFTGGVSAENSSFDPLTAGTTTLGIIQPAGYINPANGYLTRNVNVDAPNLYLQNLSGSNRTNENIGRDLQVERRIRLEVAPPAPGVDVTIEIVDPSVALISTDPIAAGSASITFPLVTGTYTPQIYVQGLALGRGTELRISAPGYDQWITTVQVVASGFYIWQPSNFTTTVSASNTTIRIRAATLDALQRVVENQEVRGGVSLSVDVISSNPSVGVITVSPLVFTGNSDYLSTAFDPIAVGMSTISITQPPGFTPPLDRTSIVATVNPW